MITFFNKKTLISAFILFLASPTISFAYIKSGLWNTACERGLLKKQIYINEFVSTEEHFHQNVSCSNLSFIFTTDGYIEFSANEKNFINFIYDKIFLSLHKEISVNDFNSRKVCGFDNWSLGEKKEITGLKCALFNVNSEAQIPTAGQRRYGLYLVIENKLYYGQLNQTYDGSSPERRPQQINRSTEYIFQNFL
jgi:hypothetical protein